MEPLQMIWATFYTGLVGWQFHPGNKEKLTDINKSLDDMATIADQMLLRYLKREEALCTD